MRYTVRVTDKYGTRDLFKGFDCEVALNIARAINKDRQDGWDDSRATVVAERGE